MVEVEREWDESGIEALYKKEFAVNEDSLSKQMKRKKFMIVWKSISNNILKNMVMLKMWNSYLMLNYKHYINWKKV